MKCKHEKECINFPNICDCCKATSDIYNHHPLFKESGWHTEPPSANNLVLCWFEYFNYDINAMHRAYGIGCYINGRWYGDFTNKKRFSCSCVGESACATKGVFNMRKFRYIVGGILIFTSLGAILTFGVAEALEIISVEELRKKVIEWGFLGIIGAALSFIGEVKK